MSTPAGSTRAVTQGDTIPILSFAKSPSGINTQKGDLTITDNAFDSPQQMAPLTGIGTEVMLS